MHAMKGVTILQDETSKKRFVQIDLELITRDREAVEDYLDAILIESRKQEPSIPLEDFEQRLQKARAK
ncbi:MAG: hypothetical protein JSS84_08430 [Bacteroidetes bacterium]|nr:hypothetical protein [Bacteroidota bacterium]